MIEKIAEERLEIDEALRVVCHEHVFAAAVGAQHEVDVALLVVSAKLVGSERLKDEGTANLHLQKGLHVAFVMLPEVAVDDLLESHEDGLDLRADVLQLALPRFGCLERSETEMIRLHCFLVPGDQ